MDNSDDRLTALAEAFGHLTDITGEDRQDDHTFDHLARSCAELLPVEAIGCSLVDSTGRLAVAYNAPHSAGLIEMFALDGAAGPGGRAHSRGVHVTVPDLDDPLWRSAFTEAARGGGFRTAHAFPMRHRAQGIGAAPSARARHIPSSCSRL